MIAVAEVEAGIWNTQVRLIPVKGLRPHPLSIHIYGEPTANAELLESVKRFGVLSAIVVNKGGCVISGTSRHFAAASCGLLEIPAVEFSGSSLDEELLVIESNRQRIKLPSVLGREFNERFRIEQELAAVRQKAGVPLKSAGGQGGDARERAARAVNLGRTAAEQLGKIVARAEKFTTTRAVLDEIDAGRKSISAAYKEMFGRESVPIDCPYCKETFPSLSKMKKHGRDVHNVESATSRRAAGFVPESPKVVRKIDEALTRLEGQVNLERTSDSYLLEASKWLLGATESLSLASPQKSKLEKLIETMEQHIRTVSEIHDELLKILKAGEGA